MAFALRSLRFYVFLAFAFVFALFLFVPRDSVTVGSFEAQTQNAWSLRENVQANDDGISAAKRPHDTVRRTPQDGTSTSSTTSGSAAGPAKGEHGDNGYEAEKIFFELDLKDYKMPNIDVSSLRMRPPHNYKGAGHPTFALFFMSRNSSLQDPYFLATHQVIYRLLWKEDTKSTKHPVTVFVPPWIGDLQRSWFQAIGAIVRDVPERPFHPDFEEVGGLVSHRFKDVFSKLDMWKHIEFSRILFLDSDAFPLVNVDALMEKELAPEQQCIPSKMFKDHPVIGSDSSVCDYVFTGAQDLVVADMTNVGVMVFKPNRAMHDLLIRQYHNTTNFFTGFVEQAFLSWIFRPDGPFPVSRIDKAWNGDPEVRDKGHELFIVHAKLWAVMFEDPNHWAGRLFWDTWANATAFYEGTEFKLLRSADGPQFLLQQPL